MIYTFPATLLLFIALTMLAYSDARTMRLPDALTLPLIGMGVVVNVMLFGTLALSLLGAVIGYGVFWAIEKAYERYRHRQGLGRGDAKLLAAGGAWCGAGGLPLIALVGAGSALLYVLIIATVHHRRPEQSDMIAFGPWLTLGIAIVWLVRLNAPELILAG